MVHVLIRQHIWMRLIVLLSIFALLTACNVGAQDFTISLKEARVNQIVQNSLASAAASELPFQVRAVDMKDGYIRVFVSYTRPDAPELIGSYDISLDAEAGGLKGQIVGMDMPGLVLDSDVVSQLAELIASDFATVSELKGFVNFLDVIIGEDSLELVVRLTPSP
jgi:hypothetical protein